MDKFSQLVVWEGIIISPSQFEEFENWMLKEFNTRAKAWQQVTTLPAFGEEGGRKDLLFWVHHEDIPHFAVKRLAVGFRWWEDVVLNGNRVLYSQEVQSEIDEKLIIHSLRKQVTHKTK